MGGIVSDDFNILGLSEAAALKLRMALCALVLLALAGLVIWYGEWRADARGAQVTARYEQAISKQKIDAATRLAEETARVRRLETELSAAHGRIEEDTREREAIARSYEGRLAALAAGAGGRLRDPHAAGCGGGGGGPAPGAAAAAGDREGHAAEAGGLLSGPLTDLLRRLAREGQEQADAYAACRADALSLRDQLSPSP
jgi:hypothetical protein